MGANIREIKGRIKAVRSIQRITKTMQMIATARFQAMQRKATDAQCYTRKIAEVVGEVATSLSESGQSALHPLLTTPANPANRHLLLVLTSNRGLCGGFNGRILNLLRRTIEELPQGQTLDLEVVGRKGLGWCKFNKIDVERPHAELGDAPSYEDVAKIAERYIKDYAAGKYDSIRIVYAAFESMSRQPATVQQLLPLEPLVADDSNSADTSENTCVQYEISPEPVELLAELLPVTVKSTLYQCFNEAVVSEQLARMIAMKSATDAAGKMSKRLKRDFNRARQAKITTELSEIIGGAAALG